VGSTVSDRAKSVLAAASARQGAEPERIAWTRPMAVLTAVHKMRERRGRTDSKSRQKRDFGRLGGLGESGMLYFEDDIWRRGIWGGR